MKKLTPVLMAALVLTLALTASAQGPGSWTVYVGNPVFGQGVGGPKAYYPSVLYDAGSFSGHGAPAKYKMWYGTSGSQTGLATSDDGISWSDLGAVMTDGYHATVKYFADGFPGTNSGGDPSGSTMYYRMWYWDVGTLYDVSAIGYTESPDGVNWYNYQPCQNGAVPIVSSGDPWWNRGSYGPCDVLYNPGASDTGTDWTFTLYYDGTTGGDEAIGLGFSSDGITWSGYDADGDGKADPVLNGTYNAGDWDYNYVSRATVIKNADDDYEMWYSGGVGAMNHGIGYATSSDGINWTRDGDNPIFHKDDGVDWRDSRTYCPAVLKDGSIYQMWFAGKGSAYSIGYATAMPPVVKVEIDVKPGSYPNSINLGSMGVVPVAVLTTDDFDASTVDPATVTFAGASPLRWTTEDVDSDGDLDLLFHFRTQELSLDGSSTVATLTGTTFGGQAIQGTDTVNIVP
ncbi:MAG: hypothetical protein JSV36_22490 [Anaerolineae bacterium]|nr:MAG: hypothetical protein JSV36_22490 [Anaerolineae bacterium]